MQLFEPFNQPGEQDLKESLGQKRQQSSVLKFQQRSSQRPLADILRPHSLADVLGQEHLLGNSNKEKLAEKNVKDNNIAPLALMVAEQNLRSMILWGPAGVGKTTIAYLLAKMVRLEFRTLSAVMSGVADLKKIFEQAQHVKQMGRGTILFVDEIHRFNRAQQDSFLPFVERGDVVLIGATTENPSFSLNNALLSRVTVYDLEPLQPRDFLEMLKRAEAYYGEALPLTDDAKNHLIDLAGGDGRYFYNLVEHIALAIFSNNANFNKSKNLTAAELLPILQRKKPNYDKDRDGHYNFISALHKSVRGSDPDAALYWLYRMLNAGEDRDFLARRIVRMAYEDIGLADPDAASHALTAWQTYERLGSPEGELALASAVVYLALAPKSNAMYRAVQQASDVAKQFSDSDPPKIILNAPTQLMKTMDYGKGYQYDHDAIDGFSGQNYFPDGMKRQEFYHPVERGFEREMLKRKLYFQELRQKRNFKDSKT